MLTELPALQDETPASSVQVPIVVDTDGSKVTESSIVVEYLDARYPEHGTRLVPADAAKAAKASNPLTKPWPARCETAAY